MRDPGKRTQISRTAVYPGTKRSHTLVVDKIPPEDQPHSSLWPLTDPPLHIQTTDNDVGSQLKLSFNVLFILCI